MGAEIMRIEEKQDRTSKEEGRGQRAEGKESVKGRDC
jgi:hypothetical protein